MENKLHYHCGPFDFDGFATENYVYPPAWKASMFFISFGFFILSATVLLTLITCCRQSIIGKSIHTITGSAQMISGKNFGTFVFMFKIALFGVIIILFYFEMLRNISDDCNIFASIRMGSTESFKIMWTRCRSILSGGLPYW